MLLKPVGSEKDISRNLEMSDKVAVDTGCSFVVPLTYLTPSDCSLLSVNVFLAYEIKIFVFYLCVHSVFVL